MADPTTEDGANCGHPNHGGRDHDCTGFLSCDDPACPCGSKAEIDRSEADRAERDVRTLADQLCKLFHDNDGEVDGGYLAEGWACQDCYDTACAVMDTPWLTARLEALAGAEAHSRALLAFDCLDDEVPEEVDVPDDYERGLHDAASGYAQILAEPITPPSQSGE